MGGYRVARLVRHEHFILTWVVINWITLRVLFLTDAVLAFVRLANTASVKQIHALKIKGKKLPHGNQHKQRQSSTSTVQLLSQSPSKVVRSLGSCRRWPFFLLLSQFCFFFLLFCVLCFFVFCFFLGFCAFCFDSYSDDTAW